MYHPADALLEEILRYVRPYPNVFGGMFLGRPCVYLTLDILRSGHGANLTFDRDRLIVHDTSLPASQSNKYQYCDPNDFVPSRIGERISEILQEHLNRLQRDGLRTIRDSYGHHALVRYFYHSRNAECHSEASAQP